MNKTLAVILALVFAVCLTGCAAKGFSPNKDIYVISREDGSGTRGAFIELFGVEIKDENGDKVDHTTLEAAITSSTSVVMLNVSGDVRAIGYISLGSLNDTVKAVPIDGAMPSIEHVKSGDYKVARPFNIATKGELSAVAQDFINFILSAEGQHIVEQSGYVAVADNAPAYTGNKPAGKVVVAGSSSVTPVMEKLKEAYMLHNANANIEVQMNDSSTGMTSAAEGSCDIGMASRALKDSELEKGLTATTIALDGIAVIVNHDNPVEGLTTEQVGSIFIGEVKTWAQAMEA